MSLDKKDAQTKKCPFCAELILKESSVCEHCGSLLSKSIKKPASKRSKKKIFLFAFFIILLVFIAGFAIFIKKGFEKREVVSEDSLIDANYYFCAFTRKYKNDLAEMKLLGNVKLIREGAEKFTTLFDRAGFKTETYMLTEKGDVWNKTVYVFRDRVFPYGALWYEKSDKLRQRIFFRFDNNCNVIEERKNFQSNVLDKNSEFSDNTSISNSYEYDSKGNKTVWKNNNVFKILDKYNRSGRLIEGSYIDFMLGGEVSKTIYKSYDSKGNVLETETHFYKGKGAGKTTTKYEYEYDENGNWIKKTEVSFTQLLENRNMGGEEAVVTEREIEYY